MLEKSATGAIERSKACEKRRDDSYVGGLRMVNDRKVELVIEALRQIGGVVPRDVWHIQLLAAKITAESRTFVSPSEVWEILRKSKRVKLSPDRKVWRLKT